MPTAAEIRRLHDTTHTFFLNTITSLISLPSWRARHTGVMALSALLTPLIQHNDLIHPDNLGGLSHNQNNGDVEKLCSEILKILEGAWASSEEAVGGESVHPRLQYAVVYAIGQLALAFEVSRDASANSV